MSSERIRATLHEVATLWSGADLLDAHIILNAIERQEQKALENRGRTA